MTLHRHPLRIGGMNLVRQILGLQTLTDFAQDSGSLPSKEDPVNLRAVATSAEGLPSEALA